MNETTNQYQKNLIWNSIFWLRLSGRLLARSIRSGYDEESSVLDYIRAKDIIYIEMLDRTVAEGYRRQTVRLQDNGVGDGPWALTRTSSYEWEILRLIVGLLGRHFFLIISNYRPFSRPNLICDPRLRGLRRPPFVVRTLGRPSCTARTVPSRCILFGWGHTLGLLSYCSWRQELYIG